MADAPVINPAWLADKRDQELAVTAFKYAYRLANTISLRRVIVGGREIPPGLALQFDTQVLEYLKNTTIIYYHAASICKLRVMNDSKHPRVVNMVLYSCCP